MWHHSDQSPSIDSPDSGSSARGPADGPLSLVSVRSEAVVASESDIESLCKDLATLSDHDLRAEFQRRAYEGTLPPIESVERLCGWLAIRHPELAEKLSDVFRGRSFATVLGVNFIKQLQVPDVCFSAFMSFSSQSCMSGNHAHEEKKNEPPIQEATPAVRAFGVGECVCAAL